MKPTRVILWEVKSFARKALTSLSRSVSSAKGSKSDHSRPESASTTFTSPPHGLDQNSMSIRNASVRVTTCEWAHQKRERKRYAIR
eukprot:7140837-Pyramimonas_sp.AAC.1